MGKAKSSKQRRAELMAKRKLRRDKQDADKRATFLARHARTLVDASKLAPDGSYSAPDFVIRGYYVDQPFTCQQCGKQEVWTATQQKWWYEVAKGGRWTVARLCRPCRRRERERRAESRRTHLEGLSRRQQRDA
jgi:hypothetical protein